MLTKEELKELATKEAARLKQMTDEEIKEEFIRSFGKEKWDEEEMLGKLIPLSMEVSDSLGIDYLPIMFEAILEDSRIYFEEEYIAISNRFIGNYLECAKCVCHELRHIFQLFYAKSEIDARAKRMKEELANEIELDVTDPESVTAYSFQEIEIDAYAFTKWYLKTRFGIEVIHPSKDYELVISAYMDKYFN